VRLSLIEMIFRSFTRNYSHAKKGLQNLINHKKLKARLSTRANIQFFLRWRVNSRAANYKKQEFYFFFMTDCKK